MKLKFALTASCGFKSVSPRLVEAEERRRIHLPACNSLFLPQNSWPGADLTLSWVTELCPLHFFTWTSSHVSLLVSTVLLEWAFSLGKAGSHLYVLFLGNDLQHISFHSLGGPDCSNPQDILGNTTFTSESKQTKPISGSAALLKWAHVFGWASHGFCVRYDKVRY